MAAGFGPDCRNISGVAESGIAGKDNENGREERRREVEKQARGEDGRGKEWTPPHIHTLTHLTLLKWIHTYIQVQVQPSSQSHTVEDSSSVCFI